MHYKIYGFWQQLNSEWRSKILINGQDTVEVDFSGMGINILYDLARIDIDDRDPYDLTGYYESNRSIDRVFVKRLRE